MSDDTESTTLPLISKDEENHEPESEVKEWALCLSGGGYRAMLFHLGSLWRLNEAGYLPKLDRISSVSGGSITAGVLAVAWDSLDFDGEGVARSFEKEVVGPVRKLAGKTIDVKGILKGLFTRGSIAEKVAKKYRKLLFGRKSLQDLPDEPRFVINATNIQTGVLWRFSKPYMGDWRIGRIPDPDFPLATAVAASSAFPPVLSPVRLEFDPEAFTLRDKTDLEDRDLRQTVYLSDGGVYDNLGLETAWKNHDKVLVSDGGGRLEAEADQPTNWALHFKRVLGVINNQVRSLRKRQLIASYVAEERGGAYWGIRTDIDDYDLDETLEAPHEATLKLARIATRLKKLEPETQERLINWGYAVTDTALRRHVDEGLAQGEFPYGGVGVG